MMNYVFIEYIFLVVTFILITGAGAISAICRFKQEISATKIPRFSNPTSFYPSSFFEEIFVKKDYAEINKLQKETEAFQTVATSKRPEKRKDEVYSISLSIRKLEQKYEACLERYLNASHDLDERKIKETQLKSKIELERRTIEKEKDVFLSYTGEYIRSFNFTRQNQGSDIFLTGISIPILLEILKWDINGVEDFLAILVEKPLMCLMIIAFWIILLHRIIKYHKNKRSMLEDMGRASEYDRVELMLYAFECALKNIDEKATS